MMHSVEVVSQAKATYLRAGSVSAVVTHLKASGYKISRDTVDRWKKEAAGTPGDWDEAAKQYVHQLAVAQAATSNFHDEMLADLVIISRDYRAKLKENPAELNAQALYALAKISGQILEIRRIKQGKQNTAEEVREEFLDFLFGDKVLAPLFMQHKEYFVDKIDKLIGKM